ncbi:MAG: hypothetical protein FVQ80_14735 [Planctomycetes bacterium]|nr:hypothetical protein [Planctomycetota bacterium]
MMGIEKVTGFDYAAVETLKQNSDKPKPETIHDVPNQLENSYESTGTVHTGTIHTDTIQDGPNPIENTYETKIVKKAINQKTGKHKIQDGPNLMENSYENKHNDTAAAEIKHSGRSDLSELHEKINTTNAAGAVTQKLGEAVGEIEKKIKKNKELVELVTKNQLKNIEKQKMLKEMKHNFVEINDIVASTNIDGNLPLGPGGKPITISLDDQTNITIPAQDFSVDVENTNIDSNSHKSMRDTIREAIKAIKDYDGFMIGIHDKIEEYSSQMQFQIEDILKVEEQISQLNDMLELSAFTIRRVRQDAAKALRGQANIEPEKALALLQ